MAEEASAILETGSGLVALDRRDLEAAHRRARGHAGRGVSYGRGEYQSASVGRLRSPSVKGFLRVRLQLFNLPSL